MVPWFTAKEEAEMVLEEDDERWQQRFARVQRWAEIENIKFRKYIAEQPFQIFVKRLLVQPGGWQIVEGRTLTLYVEANETVSKAKAKIAHEHRLPVALIGMLIYGGTPLTDGRTLSDYNIKKESILHFGTCFSIDCNGVDVYRCWKMQSELFALPDEQRRQRGQYMQLKRDLLAAKAVSTVSKTDKGRVVGLIVQQHYRLMHVLVQKEQVLIQRRLELQRLVRLQCEMWQNDVQEREARVSLGSIVV